MTRNYNIIALFSGCGGLDYGFLLYNKELMKSKNKKKFNIVWANDYDRAACCSYELNFNVELYEDNTQQKDSKERILCGDIKSVDFKKALGENKIDIVLGGFPCQDFSVLRGDRNKKGVKVKRGRLYLEFIRVLVFSKPKLFVAENVAGLVSANEGYSYNRIIEDFKHLSNSWNEITKEFDVLNGNNINKQDDARYYILFSKVINFSYLGVPQNRKRLIIIGVRGDLAVKLKEKGKLQKLEENIDTFLTGYDSIFKKYPLTPIEVFEGDTLENLNDEYKQIMKAYESKIKEIDSERKKYYMDNIWQEKYDIKKDFIKLNNGIKRNRNKNSMNKKPKLEISVSRIDLWAKEETKSDDKENPYKIQSSINWNQIMLAHETILKELGYYKKKINSTPFDDNSQELLSEQNQIIDRMEHIPPYENFKFVSGTQYQVKGLMSNIYRRIHPIFPSTTIIGRGGGGTWGYHYAQRRQRLTNRERARLQSFPDDFNFSGRSSEIRAQIGNAVPPLAGKRIAEIIYMILEKIGKNNRRT